MMQLCITFYVLVIGSETSSSKKQMFFKKLDSDWLSFLKTQRWLATFLKNIWEIEAYEPPLHREEASKIPPLTSFKKDHQHHEKTEQGKFLVLVENFLLLRKGRKDGRKRRGGKEGKARESSFTFQRLQKILAHTLAMK